MLFLVTDTSGKHGFVALVRAGEGAEPNAVEVIEEVPLAGGTFSAQLVPQIAALLSEYQYSKSDIGAFVVVSGPGSFTGLRVGLAAVKALAEILQKPIAAVSLLEALAQESGASGRVFTALDAGRDEVYVGEYEVAAGGARLVTEKLVVKDEFLSFVKGMTVATRDEAVANAARQAGAVVLPHVSAGALAIARLGWQKLQSGEVVSSAGLEANYIRRSDAEIFAKISS